MYHPHIQMHSIYILTHTYTPHTLNNFLTFQSTFNFISWPKSFILQFPTTALIMSQTSIKASLLHDLVRHLCRISFCCLGFGFLVISVRTPSEMISLCLRSYTIVLASVHFMKLSRKKLSTSSAAQKETSRHINNKHSNLSSSSQMWHTQTHHPSTHCENTFLTEGGDDHKHSPVTSRDTVNIQPPNTYACKYKHKHTHSTKLIRPSSTLMEAPHQLS